MIIVINNQIDDKKSSRILKKISINVRKQSRRAKKIFRGDKLPKILPKSTIF
jgi:hypothetical protein